MKAMQGELRDRDTETLKEMNNVYGENFYREVRADLEERLLQWYLRTSDAVPWEDDCRTFE